MQSRHRWLRFSALLFVLALAATACRGQDQGAAPGTDEGTDTGTEQTPGEDTEGDAEGQDVKTDVGVTDDPCPEAVNADNGCIYLGIISDLTAGPFAALANPITDAQKAFWREVNQAGGIGGYDVDVESYIRDNKYDPQVHKQVYEEIKPNVLGLAQTLGSPTTAAIIDDLRANNVVSVPASWTSLWEFEDVILESGTNYCIEAINSVDYAMRPENLGEDISVMAVHYPGDYGDDAAAGAQIAAERNGLEFFNVETPPGQDKQAEAIEAMVRQAPDLVILTTGPTDAAVIVGQAAARGFQGRVIGTSPTWNPGLLQSPAAPAFKALYLQSAYWPGFEADTPGHNRMREALKEHFGDVQGNDGYTSGWVWSYPMRAALERAAENGDLTRQGLVNAVKELENVDYEGMLPEDAGRFAGEPNETVVRQIIISQPDDSSVTGVRQIEDFFVGPTAEEFELTQPCFEQLKG